LHRDTANAAGSLNTTTRDYARFLQAILSGEGLKPETLREMETPQIAVDPDCFICTDHAPKRLSENLFWGLGWSIEKNASGTYLWHYGDNGVFKAFTMVDLRRKSAFVYFANSSNGLAIAPDVAYAVLGGEHRSFDWVKYDRWNSVAMQFSLYSRQHAMVDTMHHFAPQIADGSVSEAAMNSYGYYLLGKKMYAEAISVLAKNVALYPKSSNTYDSLGEAYLVAGDKAMAIANYAKELELDPTNGGAKAALKKINNP
jgi:CubicO group peptidase (beta-lactamase class C family)